MTSKKARDQLGSIRKSHKQTVHKLGNQISRLVKIAYPHQDLSFHTEKVLETFSQALNHTALQQHLLGRPHQTISEAARIAEEFLYLETRRPSIQQVDEGATTLRSQPIPVIKELLGLMKNLIDNQNRVMEQMAQKPHTPYRPQKQQRQPTGCCNCGGPHFKPTCPKLLPTEPNQTSGNENCPIL